MPHGLHTLRFTSVWARRRHPLSLTFAPLLPYRWHLRSCVFPWVKANKHDGCPAARSTFGLPRPPVSHLDSPLRTLFSGVGSVGYGIGPSAITCPQSAPGTAEDATFCDIQGTLNSPRSIQSIQSLHDTPPARHMSPQPSLCAGAHQRRASSV